MSFQAMNWAREIRTGSPALKAVLLAVANYADADGSCWPSQERIAHDTELTDRTVRTALKELEARGFLTREERRARGRRSDLIRLVLPETVSGRQPERVSGRNRKEFP